MGLLAVVLVASNLTMTGGDDRDPARQRPGILDLGELPVPAPRLPGIETGGEKTVVFFAGRSLTKLCTALRDPPAELEATIIVVAGRRSACGTVTTVPMSPAEAAEAYGLSSPRDGGAPLGYAIVDQAGRIRYRTLDPVVATMLQEVKTMLEDIR